MSRISQAVTAGVQRLRKVVLGFRFGNFSTRQAQLVTWWLRYPDATGVIAQGAIRSGKTIAVIVGFILWTLIRFHREGREADFIIASKTMGALKRNVLKPMFKILKAFGVPYTYSRSSEAPFVRIGLVTYYLFAGNNEASQDTLQGFTAAGALLDEVVLMPESFVDQAIGRCSEEGSKLWFTCNPGGPSHWFKKRFVDQAEEKELVNLHFTLDDNPSLAQSIRERYRRMFTGVFFQRYILGLWVLAEGVIYSMWDRAVHVVSPDAAPKRFRHYAVSVDYGTANPTVFLLWGWNDRKAVYCVHAFYHDGRKAEQAATDDDYLESIEEAGGTLGKILVTDEDYAARFDTWVKKQLPFGVTLDETIVDPSARGFIAALRKRGYQVKKAKNDVVDGIRFTQSCLSRSAQPYDEGAPDGSVPVYFLEGDHLAAIEREIESYTWDPKAQAKGEDKPAKVNDHVPDALRYFLFTQFFRSLSSNAMGWLLSKA